MMMMMMVKKNHTKTNCGQNLIAFSFQIFAYQHAACSARARDGGHEGATGIEAKARQRGALGEAGSREAISRGSRQ